MNRKLRNRSLAAAAAALSALSFAPVASAGPLVASAPNCDAQGLSQPFLPWADVASYTLDPGGSFERGAKDWSLDNAAVKDGNEPFYVTAGDDTKSLHIALGGSATSAPICVGLEHPDIRFFAKGSSPGAVLKVEVLFETATGDVVTAPIGAVAGNTDWSPSAPMPIVANLLPLLPGNYTPVAFRFSASGGCFRIDDLYVDPYSRN
jgi:hypothetical protein